MGTDSNVDLSVGNVSKVDLSVGTVTKFDLSVGTVSKVDLNVGSLQSRPECGNSLQGYGLLFLFFSVSLLTFLQLDHCDCHDRVLEKSFNQFSMKFLFSHENCM